LKPRNLVPLFRADWSARHRLSLHLDLYDMQSLIPRRYLQYSQRSLFTSAVLNQSHYETLGVPRNASTKQVKATFYKLSKELHPDVNKHYDDAAKARFQALNEAYAILGDERLKRDYDRSLALEHRPTNHGHAHGFRSPGTDFARRRGATHAWQQHSRSARSHTAPPPGAPPPPHNYPFHSPHVRRATGAKKPDSQWKADDRIRRDSGFLRVAQVFGIVWVVMTLSGGWSVSAA